MSGYWDLIYEQNSSKSIFKSTSLIIKLSCGGIRGIKGNENVKLLIVFGQLFVSNRKQNEVAFLT